MDVMDVMDVTRRCFGSGFWLWLWLEAVGVPQGKRKVQVAGDRWESGTGR